MHNFHLRTTWEKPWQILCDWRGFRNGCLTYGPRARLYVVCSFLSEIVTSEFPAIKQIGENGACLAIRLLRHSLIFWFKYRPAMPHILGTKNCLIVCSVDSNLRCFRQNTSWNRYRSKSILFHSIYLPQSIDIEIDLPSLFGNFVAVHFFGV